MTRIRILDSSNSAYDSFLFFAPRKVGMISNARFLGFVTYEIRNQRRVIKRGQRLGTQVVVAAIFLYLEPTIFSRSYSRAGDLFTLHLVSDLFRWVSNRG